MNEQDNSNGITECSAALGNEHAVTSKTEHSRHQITEIKAEGTRKTNQK